ncbi:MAG TPA: sigma 54-interacting transcriptional regulator [Candidatus Acidoferrum sp.]
MATTFGSLFEQSAEAGPVRGQAPIMQSLNATIQEIARTDIPVLLVGESGTGKEVYARLIHRLSGLGEATLKKVSCAALDAGQLLEEVRAEFLTASGGRDVSPRTVFLDGVHDLDAVCQRALLSLLPDGEPRGLAGKSIPRFISSTSRSLEKEIEAGRFRRELYFRINGVVLRLPPLRDRREDIPALLDFFFQKHSNKLEKKTPALNSDVRELLDSYDWPGNIRELENVAKRILAVGDPSLALADLCAARLAVPVNDDSWNISSLKAASRAACRHTERELIQKALERTHWNRKRAAHDLQISYKSLLYKIKQTGLEGKKTEQG